MRTFLVLALATLLPAAPALAQQTCLNTTDLLAWWKADGSTLDATGQRHGTFVGTARYETGQTGEAFSFDGASYVAVPYDAAFTVNSGVTVAAWIKRGADFGFLGPILKMPGTADNAGIAMEMFGEVGWFSVAVEPNEFHRGGWSPFLGAAVPADVWTHLAGTYDGNYVRFYLNGQLAASQHVPGQIRLAGGELHIGHDPINSNRFVKGPVDDVIVFGAALNDGDVRLLYEGALGACPLDARERPAVAWNPAAITTLTPLDGSHLNAASPVPGRFEYFPAAGARLPDGPATLAATFIPDDQLRYRTINVYRKVNVAWQDFPTDPSAPFVSSVVTDVGGMWFDAVVEASRDRVWIVSASRNALVALDGKTGAEVASIPVATRLSGLLAFDDVRGHIYAGEGDRSVIRVFDAQTHAEINSFAVASTASALFVEEASSRLYVGLMHLGRVDAFALPVQSGTLPPPPVASVTLGDSGLLIASDPARKILYVHGAELLAVDIDPQRATFQSVLWRQPVNGLSIALAVNARTGMVYVAEGHPARGIQVIDGRRDSPAFGTFLGSFAVPFDSSGARDVSGLAINPVTNILYAQLADVTGSESPVIPLFIALDAASGELLAELRLNRQVSQKFYAFGGWVSTNPATNRIYVVADYGALSIFHHRPRESQPIADDSVVAPVTVATPGAAVTFGDVVQGGALQVQPIDVSAAGIPAAGQFKLTEAVGFEISTTANAVAPFTVCLNASHVTDPDVFAALSLLHAETVNGTYQWVDRTVSRDFASGSVCGQTMSLSPYAVAERVGPRYSLTVGDLDRPRQPGSAIPVRVRVVQDGTAVSDPALRVVAVDVMNLQTHATTAALDRGSANAGGAFRFDQLTGAYIFNLSTGSLGPGAYALRIRIGSEPAMHTVRFEIR